MRTRREHIPQTFRRGTATTHVPDPRIRRQASYDLYDRHPYAYQAVAAVACQAVVAVADGAVCSVCILTLLAPKSSSIDREMEKPNACHCISCISRHSQIVRHSGTWKQSLQYHRNCMSPCRSLESPGEQVRCPGEHNPGILLYDGVSFYTLVGDGITQCASGNMAYDCLKP